MAQQKLNNLMLQRTKQDTNIFGDVNTQMSSNNDYTTSIKSSFCNYVVYLCTFSLRDNFSIISVFIM